MSSMVQRVVRYRNPKVLAAAAHRNCKRCGRKTKTEVRAHYSGYLSHTLGKGQARKCDDHCSTVLCDKCHQYFDGYENGNDASRAAEFLILCLQSVRDDIDEGLL